ncbi:unnamed protein product [Rhodiola kirilowii]
MSSRVNSISVSVLRLLTLVFLASSILVLGTDTFTTTDGTKTTFINLITYRYVMAISILFLLYTLIQMPFSIYHACRDKKLVRNDNLPELGFYCDQVAVLLLATCVGAGFGVTFEFQRLLEVFIKSSAVTTMASVDDREKLALEKFLDKGNTSCALVLLGLVCMVLVIVFSKEAQT